MPNNSVDRLQPDFFAGDPDGIAIDDTVNAHTAVTEAHTTQRPGRRCLRSNDLETCKSAPNKASLDFGDNPLL
jgi:hypothetical protein